MVEGYTLIASKDHYHCMGALPKSLQEEYKNFTSEVKAILEDLYGKCISYEHGRVGFCNVQPGEQLCYHAHSHIVPVNGDLIPLFEKEGLYPYKLQGDNTLFSEYAKYGHYLFYENNEGDQYIIQINQPIRRQYLRHLTATLLGNPELASWSEYPEYDKLYSAVKKVNEYVESKSLKI